MDYEKLIDKSIKSQAYSYAPYSKITVGAALLAKSGKIYTGCNVENSSYGATSCAERNAVYNAISEGESEFCAIAITSNLQEHIYPCGICRQVLNEFAPDIEIVLSDSSGNIKITNLRKLLPNSFNL